jgi:pyruvate dehydrogenase E2 component (dihydrolipoamide acetyltransferase)
MSGPVEVRLPALPECWESCGACRDEEVLISEIWVKPGDQVWRDDPIISLETDKTTLDIPAPCSGRVGALHVEIGDPITEGMPILTLQPE